MLDAFAWAEDWTGTLTAVALHRLSSNDWRLCWEIVESFPEQCGSGVVLGGARPAYLSSPQLFSPQAGEGSDQPSVEVSDTVISVQGTFFADSAPFVPA